MKQIKNITGSLLLAFTYCLVIFNFSHAKEFQIGNDSNDVISSKAKHIEFVSESQTSIGYTLNLSIKGASEFEKLGFNSLLSVSTFYPESLISSVVKQYTKRSKTRKIRYRKTDSIFPFHYHW